MGEQFNGGNSILWQIENMASGKVRDINQKMRMKQRERDRGRQATDYICEFGMTVCTEIV